MSKHGIDAAGHADRLRVHMVAIRWTVVTESGAVYSAVRVMGTHYLVREQHAGREPQWLETSAPLPLPHVGDVVQTLGVRSTPVVDVLAN